MRKLALSCALQITALLLWPLSEGCQSTTKPDPTPEETVRQWQRHIDHNEFAAARKLSIEQALSYVDTLDQMIDNDTVQTEETVILGLRCEITGDTAQCQYSVQFEGREMPGKIGLCRVKGQWFVQKVGDYQPAPTDTLNAGDENLIFPDTSR